MPTSSPIEATRQKGLLKSQSGENGTTPSTPKKEAPIKKAITVLGLLAWVGVSMVVGQVVVGFIMVKLLGGRVGEPIWMTVYTGATYVFSGVMAICVPWWVGKRGKASREGMGLMGLPTWTDIGLSVVGFGAYYILAILLTALFSLLPWFNSTQVQEVGYGNFSDVWQVLVAFVAIVIIAPIAEEMVFRGWLYGKVRSRIGMWGSMILVSILFGMVHGQWNVGVNVFALSMVMCGLREITGTIYGGIILHMIKNGVAFYLLFFVI